MDAKQAELLKQLRSFIFSGTEFTDATIKRFSGLYKGLDVKEAINKARQQTRPAELPNTANFDKILKLHKCRERIFMLMGSHPEYLLNEVVGGNGGKPFDELCRMFETGNTNQAKVEDYTKYLEARAKKQETKDTKDRLFETLRDFTQWCKEFLLNNENKPLYPALSRNFTEIIIQISEKVSKVGINIIDYRDLSENCFATLLRKSGTYEKFGFQYILTLINLRCEALGVDIPLVTASVSCPACGEKGQQGNICNQCGAYLKCPGCKAVINKNAKLCGGCGIEIDNIPLYLKRIEDAEKKLNNGDYKFAAALLSPIKVKWAANEQIVAILNRITQFETRLADNEKKLKEYIHQTKYFAAQQIIYDIKKETELSSALESLENQINERIEQAKSFVSKGDSIQDTIHKIGCYAKGLNLVSDFNTAAAKISQQSLLISGFVCNLNGTLVKLNWDKIEVPHVNIQYIVYRENISHKKAPEKLCLTAANSYNDTIETGISYIYSVQVQFGVPGSDSSVLSAGIVKSAEVIALGEIVINKTIGGNRMVSFEFTPPKNVFTIKIARSDGKIFNENYINGKFTDTDVVNDSTYSYKIVSCFKSQSKGIIETSGVIVNVTPTAPPLPVKLKATTKTDFTEISWVNPAKGTVVLIMCDEKLPYIEGELIDISTLQGSVINAANPTATKIPHNFHGVKYLYPITIHGASNVIGSPVIIQSVQQVKNVSFKKLDDKKIQINWQWDDSINKVVIFSQTDNNTEVRQFVTKNPGIKSGECVLNITQGAKSMKVGIASYFKYGNTELISERSEQVFSLQLVKLNFMELTKGGLFSKNKYRIKVQVNAPLPCDLYLLIGEGRTPMDMNNYKSHLTIRQNDLPVNQCCEFTVDYSRKDKSKTLIFRLIPSNLKMMKSIVISPETKQIK